jgi:hypothetical protein
MVKIMSKNKGGAPKKKLSELPDNWYNQVLDLYKEGASDVEVKALIYDWLGTFSNSLWNRWIEEEEQFSQTIKKGKMLSEAWWSRSGRVNLKEREFNYTGWYMNMKNRFGWADKQEIEQSGTVKVIGITTEF